MKDDEKDSNYRRKPIREEVSRLKVLLWGRVMNTTLELRIETIVDIAAIALRYG